MLKKSSFSLVFGIKPEEVRKRVAETEAFYGGQRNYTVSERIVTNDNLFAGNKRLRNERFTGPMGSVGNL